MGEKKQQMVTPMVENVNFSVPGICRSSLINYECFNKNCKYMHIKGTKRQRPNTEKAAIPTMLKGKVNLTYAEECHPQLIEKVN